MAKHIVETTYLTLEVTTDDGGEPLGAAIIKSQLNEEIGKKSKEPLAIAFDAIESLVMAHAAAGVDVSSPRYREGIESAVEACSNHLG